MRYWWVNQNQTYRQEIAGGYMWSPKRKSNNARNPFYDFMREVAPGDVVFSFFKTKIPAIGIAQSHAYEAPKPIEFGSAGAYWDTIGWRVDVRFTELRTKIRPVDHIHQIRPYLPMRYAPLHPNGSGLQSVYLTVLPETLAGVIIDLIGREARDLVQVLVPADREKPLPAIGLIEWEEVELARLRDNTTIDPTEREALILARRGQGRFKRSVMQFERSCRITGVDREEHLRASHTKPWRDSSNEERLDGENGLLLTPSIDHLFDRGFISFEDDGSLLISPVAHLPSLAQMRVPDGGHNVGRFSAGQERYLDYHRESVFLKSAFLS